MEIATIVKCSFIDYPSKIAAVVFTPGCNLRCHFCHNRRIIDGDSVTCGTTQKEAIAWLETRHGLLDAVVISGGEPTLQTGLPEFIEEVRALGYLAKLDTNGTQPAVLAALLETGLLDYVAMDIKAPRDKYDAICGVPVDQSAIDESIALLMGGGIEYEFRTTVVPLLTPDDLLAIGNRIRGAQAYVLQQYRELQPIGRPYDPHGALSPGPPAWLDAVQQRLCPKVEDCSFRGFEVRPERQAKRTETFLKLPPPYGWNAGLAAEHRRTSDDAESC